MEKNSVSLNWWVNNLLNFIPCDCEKGTFLKINWVKWLDYEWEKKVNSSNYTIVRKRWNILQIYYINWKEPNAV